MHWSRGEFVSRCLCEKMLMQEKKDDLAQPSVINFLNALMLECSVDINNNFVFRSSDVPGVRNFENCKLLQVVLCIVADPVSFFGSGSTDPVLKIRI